MTTIHHAIKIAAPREKVFKAFTDVTEFAKWHYTNVEDCDHDNDDMIACAPSELPEGYLDCRN